MSSDRQFFPGIHALRAVAATLVVFQHAGFIAKNFLVFEYDIDNDYFIYGRVGVILFFAISGFVIALQRTKPAGTFVVHRLLRIYPSYWLALSIAALAFGIVGLPVYAGPSAILLFPWNDSEGGMSIPYWTLTFEMAFYTLAAMAFACRFSDRTLTIIALFWIGAVDILAANPANAAEYSFPGRWILLSSPVQVFPMGLICGIHFEKFKRAGRLPYLIGCIIAFACGLPLPELSVVKVLFHGFSSCCLILAVADLDIRSRVVKALGNASYGTYLIHFPVMVTAAAISPLHGIFWFFAIGMMGGILFGTMDHYGQMAIATIRRRS